MEVKNLAFFISEGTGHKATSVDVQTYTLSRLPPRTWVPNTVGWSSCSWTF